MNSQVKGNRKKGSTRETHLLMTFGFIVAACANRKVEPVVFFYFCVGLAGALGAFVWGNAKEHEHAAKARR